MKTRYKILIVFAITLSVYVGLFLGMISCSSASECPLLDNLYGYVGFSIMMSMCSENEKINNPECDSKITGIILNNGEYFLFFFIVIPSSIIITIWYRDRK